jgi:hypothetical protein
MALKLVRETAPTELTYKGSDGPLRVERPPAVFPPNALGLLRAADLCVPSHGNLGKSRGRSRETSPKELIMMQMYQVCVAAMTPRLIPHQIADTDVAHTVDIVVEEICSGCAAGGDSSFNLRVLPRQRVSVDEDHLGRDEAEAATQHIALRVRRPGSTCPYYQPVLLPAKMKQAPDT